VWCTALGPSDATSERVKVARQLLHACTDSHVQDMCSDEGTLNFVAEEASIPMDHIAAIDPTQEGANKADEVQQLRMLLALHVEEWEENMNNVVSLTEGSPAAAERLSLRHKFRISQVALALTARLTNSAPGAWAVWCRALGDSDDTSEREKVAMGLLRARYTDSTLEEIFQFSTLPLEFMVEKDSTLLRVFSLF